MGLRDLESCFQNKCWSINLQMNRVVFIVYVLEHLRDALEESETLLSRFPARADQSNDIAPIQTFIH
jgi:hypothetical protein